MKKFFVLLITVMTAYNPAHSQNRIISYPAPEGVEMKKDFTVDVRTPDGKWQNVPTYMVKVDEVKETKHHVEKSSLGYFDFEGNAEVRIISHTAVKEARVRPLSYNIVPEITGDTIYFTLDTPRNLSIEVNGNIFHNLHLFANPIDKNTPKKKNNKNLIYFAPGVHQLSGDTLNIASGTTVYIAGGAVVRGTLQVHNAQNVKIKGRGIVHPLPKGAGVHIKQSKNIEVEGIITTQCPTGESDGVTIRNVKAISSYGWGDGMNVFASSNVLFDGVFCRNSDDCTTVYATRLGHKGSSRNIKMQNSTLWADVAHPIFIGIHGDAEGYDVIENIVYENIDILDHKEKQLDYQGCMAINGGDNNMIRNIRFENIRIEDFRQGQLVNIRIFYNKKYCKAPGLGIENILFKDITYNGKNAEISIISGYNEERKVKNIRFENLRINGAVISDDMPGKPSWYKTGDMSRIYIGEHTENITFVK